MSPQSHSVGVIEIFWRNRGKFEFCGIFQRERENFEGRSIHIAEEDATGSERE